jgi:uncharacterized membrane protein YgaE (UPF0421/DUF939 family)
VKKNLRRKIEALENFHQRTLNPSHNIRTKFSRYLEQQMAKNLKKDLLWEQYLKRGWMSN